MNYVITGASGNIGSIVAKNLLDAGHQVTVIGRTEKSFTSLANDGAIVKTGNVEDRAFVQEAFAGADAVYTMVPPNWSPVEWKSWIGRIGKVYADAIKANNIKKVVNLSSIGAHLPDGVGPVSGLYRVEEALNAIEGVDVLHLRPSYFYQNFFGQVGLIKNAGIMGANFETAPGKFPLTDPRDIATVATKALLEPDFMGHTVTYVVSDLSDTASIAATLGKAAGKGDLQWIKFAKDQAIDGMIGAGLHPEVARNYAEMNDAMDNGKMFEHYFAIHPIVNGNIKLTDFATSFAAVYNAA